MCRTSRTCFSSPLSLQPPKRSVQPKFGSQIWFLFGGWSCSRSVITSFVAYFVEKIRSHRVLFRSIFFSRDEKMFDMLRSMSLAAVPLLHNTNMNHAASQQVSMYSFPAHKSRLSHVGVHATETSRGWMTSLARGLFTAR